MLTTSKRTESESLQGVAWGSLTWVVSTVLFCLIAAAGISGLAGTQNIIGAEIGLSYPPVSVGLVAVALAICSLAFGWSKSVLIAARAVVALSFLAILIFPHVNEVQDGVVSAESEVMLRWLLAACLALFATVLFMQDFRNRPRWNSMTQLVALVGIFLPLSKLVESISSVISSPIAITVSQLPFAVAIALFFSFAYIIYYSADSASTSSSKRLRIFRLYRAVGLLIACGLPLAVHVSRAVQQSNAGLELAYSDVLITTALIIILAASTWYGLDKILENEDEVRKVKSKLETSNSRYARALKSAKIGAWELTVQTNELYWSEEIAQLFGYKPGEIETTRENFLGAVHPDDRQTVINAVNSCIFEGLEYDLEHRVVWPDGTVRWMHERGDVERNELGEAIKLIGVVEDVTDKKIALMKLAESEAKYEAVVLNVPGVVYRIVVVDGEPEFEYISPTASELFEIENDEVMDLQLVESLMHPDDFISMKESILDQENLGSVTWTGRLIFKDRTKWLESISMHTIDSDKRIRVDGVVYDVTERIESENKLSESEARYERMADKAPGMMYQMIHWPDDRITIPYLSLGVEEVFGLSQESVLDNPKLFSESLHEEDRSGFYELINEARGKLEDFVWNGRINRTDGEVRSIQISCRPSALDEERILWDGMIIDVTDEKRAAEEYRVTRDRLSDILSSSPTVIYACEAHSPFALNYISDNVQEHLGFSPEECLEDGSFLSDKTHPDDRGMMLKTLDDIERTGYSVFEYRILNSADEYRWIRDEIRFVVRPDKREIVGTLIDITERKHAEDALRLSDERFRAMSGASPLGIFMADDKGEFIYVNSKMTEVLKVGQDKLFGNRWRDFVYEEDIERVTSILTRSINSKTPFALECRLLRSDINVIWCSMKAAPMFDKGELVGFVGTVEDITDRHELEIETEQARIESERANQAKSEFLSRMSHELRTPLNAILGYAQLLEMESSFEDGEPLSQIMKGGRHLLSLINEVLDIAKIESGDLGIELEPIKIKSIIDEVSQLLLPIAHEKAVALDVKISSDDMTYVLADPQRLKQVILNVVSNSIKYNKPEGFVTVMIEHNSDNSIELVVRDTGQGIPSDKLYRLFTPFDRLGAEASKVEGSGLGLALTYRLLSAMNGSIEIDSEEGIGTVARITLQLAENPELSLAPLTKLVLESKQDQGKTARILLIEDNEANIKLMETIFNRRSHYTLDIAMTGSLGIDLANKHRPDLILLDVNLPDSVGTNVIDRLKSDPILKDTDVIVISADANKKQVERFQNAGAIAYLTKPVNVGELLRLVDGVLDHV